MKSLLALCIVLTILTAYAFWQQELANQELEQLKYDLLEAGVEIERLDAQVQTYKDIVHAIRAGRME